MENNELQNLTNEILKLTDHVEVKDSYIKEQLADNRMPVVSSFKLIKEKINEKKNKSFPATIKFLKAFNELDGWRYGYVNESKPHLCVFANRNINAVLRVNYKTAELTLSAFTKGNLIKVGSGYLNAKDFKKITKQILVELERKGR